MDEALERQRVADAFTAHFGPHVSLREGIEDVDEILSQVLAAADEAMDQVL